MNRYERKDKKCPCCEMNDLEEINEYEVCSICGWEDDPYQFENPDLTGANPFSLNDYRKKWQAEKIKPINHSQ